mmetsp:Transcript_4069/g.6906  ORF Transcript_4069/g.6906 Transcript_4069/m.6906 type:complete len:377 (-) Transcript_4069:91-1221(-)
MQRILVHFLLLLLLRLFLKLLFLSLSLQLLLCLLERYIILKRVSMRMIIHHGKVQLVETDWAERHRHTVQHHIFVHHTAEVFAVLHAEQMRDFVQQDLTAAPNLEPVRHIAVQFVIHSQLCKRANCRLSGVIVFAVDHFVVAIVENAHFGAHANQRKDVAVVMVVRRQFVVDLFGDKHVSILVLAEHDIVGVAHVDVLALEAKVDVNELLELLDERVVDEVAHVVGNGHQHDLVALLALRDLVRVVVQCVEVPAAEGFVHRLLEVLLVFVFVAEVLGPQRVVEQDVVDGRVHDVHGAQPEVDVLRIDEVAVLVLFDVVVAKLAAVHLQDVQDGGVAAQRSPILHHVEVEVGIVRIAGKHALFVRLSAPILWLDDGY